MWQSQYTGCPVCLGKFDDCPDCGLENRSDMENSDWILWSGGDCPVHAKDVVEVRLSDGSFITDCGMDDDQLWSHVWGPQSVISYRYIHKHSDSTQAPVYRSGESDPNGKDPHAPGAKLDSGKTLPWLFFSGFSNALSEVADVTTVGAKKYTPNGWQEVPDGETRYMEAFGRHMLALGRGETHDWDTGCMHKAQMIWNLLASLELELRRVKE